MLVAWKTFPKTGKKTYTTDYDYCSTGEEHFG